MDWDSSPGEAPPPLRVLFWYRLLAGLGLLLVCGAGCQAGTAPVSPPPGATLALLGDLMLGRDVRPSTDTFTYLQPNLAQADLALANLESPLTSATPQAVSPYILCAPPSQVRYLAEAGLDLLTLANNHHLDCGAAGLAETRETLATAGLGTIGPEAEPVYRIINDLPLAFLAFDATGDFNPETAAQAVRTARETGALVIVSLHWGLEYQSGATTAQEHLATQLAEAGAALIWGHHPHVLQPATWLNHGKTLVLYSLGNALFDQHHLASTRQSALVILKLNEQGVETMRVIPFELDLAHYRLVEPSRAARTSILASFEHANRP